MNPIPLTASATHLDAPSLVVMDFELYILGGVFADNSLSEAKIYKRDAIKGTMRRLLLPDLPLALPTTPDKLVRVPHGLMDC